MYAKLETDHEYADEPKAYENADTNRVAWVLEDADQLIKAEAEARTELGPPIRCKNNYQVSFDASETKGYRAMLCNYLYDPKKTWGELESEVKAAAVEVKRIVQGVLAALCMPEAKIAVFGAGVDAVAAEFGAEMRESPAKLVVEIQFMTKEYYAMRKKTHAWYKAMRSEHAFGMVMDYGAGL